MDPELTLWLVENDTEETTLRSEVDTLIVFEKDGCQWALDEDITNTVWDREGTPCE